MLSEKEERIARSKLYMSFVKRRNRLSYGLVAFLFGMVLVLDILSVGNPGFMGAPAWTGTVLSRGLLFGFFIVWAIVGAAIYYVHWINTEFSKLEKLIEQEMKE